MTRTVVFILLACWAVCSRADITFDFHGTIPGSLGAALEGLSGPVTYTNDRIAATFTASDGTMNANAGSFGINSNLSGEDSAGFDPGEWLDITFDRSVTLTGLSVSSWNSGVDIAVIYISGVSNDVIAATGNHSFARFVGAGDVLRISGTEGVLGNGWSLDTMTVIPEPATFAMIGLGALLAIVIRHSSRS